MHSYATNQEQQYKEEVEAHLRTIANQTPLTSIANGFAKYARRQEVTRFLARYEMFKMVHIDSNISKVLKITRNSKF